MPSSVTRRHFFAGLRRRRGQDRAWPHSLGECIRCGGSRSRPRAVAGIDPLAPKPPHFAPKAKRVIHLFMAGAPSQLDLFDYKPELARLEGKPLAPLGDRRAAVRVHPAGCRRARPAVQVRPARPVRRRAFGDAAAPGRCRRRHLPRSSRCSTDQFNHAPAQIFFNTGFSQPGRPSLGSWVALRAGVRDAGPAGVRRHVHR